MKKIAVTGANGFVGSHLVDKLITDGYDVISLVRKGSDVRLMPQNAKIKFINYNNKAELEKVLSDCQILIHNAGITRAKSWTQFQVVNIDFTTDLMNLCNSIKSMEQFIYISSQAASGPSQDACTPKIESNKNEPVTMYGKSKFLAEKIIKKNCKKAFTIIRPVSVYGAGDKDFLQYFKLVDHHLAVHLGFTQKFFSFIHVSQLAEMISKTILNKNAFNETFFAVGNPKCSMKDFVSNIESAAGKKTISIHIPNFLLYPVALMAEFISQFTSRTSIVNRDKINEFKENYWLASGIKGRRKLNFEPQEEMESLIKKTYTWYKEKNWL